MAAEVVKDIPTATAAHLTSWVRAPANSMVPVWAAADMLACLGEQKSTDAILCATTKVCKEGKVTADMGGTLNTRQATAEIHQILSQEIEKV